MKFFSKKIIPLLLILTFSLQILPINTAEATFPVIDYTAKANAIQQSLTLRQIAQTLSGTLPGAAQKDAGAMGNSAVSYDGIATIAIRFIIRQLTQSIVDWINSGFEGNPSFIEDPEQFLTDTADRVIGEYIFNGPLNFLCDPFRINIQLSLGLQYRPYQDRIRCTLSGVLQNVENAYDDFVGGNFINGGGWDSWLQVTTIPQNNAPGAMLMAQAQLDASIQTQQGTASTEANWGSGLLTFKRCSVNTYQEIQGENGVERQLLSEGETFYGSSAYRTSSSTVSGTNNVNVTECTTETPGSAINSWMTTTLNTDLRQLEIADEINEIFSALANFMITQMLQEGQGLFSSSNTNQNASNQAWWNSTLTNLSTQNSITSDVNSAVSSGRSGASVASNAVNRLSNINNLGQQGGQSGVLNALRAQALSLINSKLLLENQYGAILLPIRDIFVQTEQVYLDMINCYTSKLSSSTVPLSETQRNDANVRIGVASSTIAQYIAPYKEYIIPNSAITDNNINTLNQAKSTVQNTQYQDQIEDIMTNINSITSWRTTEDIDNLNNYISTNNISTSTLQGVYENGNNNMQACEVFPQ